MLRERGLPTRRSLPLEMSSDRPPRRAPAPVSSPRPLLDSEVPRPKALRPPYLGGPRACNPPPPARAPRKDRLARNPAPSTTRRASSPRRPVGAFARTPPASDERTSLQRAPCERETSCLGPRWDDRTSGRPVPASAAQMGPREQNPPARPHPSVGAPM